MGDDCLQDGSGETRVSDLESKESSSKRLELGEEEMVYGEAGEELRFFVH